jgi:mannose-6-phosphate isomerase-like protein (cupin superfamily)
MLCCHLNLIFFPLHYIFKNVGIQLFLFVGKNYIMILGSFKGVIKMTGYVGNIEDLTLKNSYFRQVLFTGKYAQLVVMCLKAKEEIGMEVHPNVDQFFRIEKGEAKFVIAGEEHLLKDGEVAIVPAGSEHNVINVSEVDDLKLYTIYSPPNHPDGTIHKTKAEAMKEE